jgi:exodeoxyribonuclease VII large subunit
VTPSRAPSRVVGVKRLAEYLKRKIETDQQLRAVSVRGEVSNLSVSPRGHMNFDLKEGDAILRCFAWADDHARFPLFKNGVAIVASGHVSTYVQKSSYQLIVRAVEREGVGDVHALFEERKKRLAAEGLFDPARKRPLPAFPFRVALVSSRGAAGALDFVSILRERAPHVRVVWCETSVQGPNAPAEITSALARASREDVDLIVVTRGGGSFEDLFAFSDEGVVRAIARARHPVVSAIGHTSDQQLSDFAADVHVETPTAAAKAVGFDVRELRARLEDRSLRAERAAELCLERLRSRLSGALVRSRLGEPRFFLALFAQRLDDLDTALRDSANAALRSREAALRNVARRLDLHDPSRRLAERAARLQRAAMLLDGAIERRVERARRARDEANARLEPAARGALQRAAQRLALAEAHLDGNNPEAILQRGYAIVTHRGAIVRDPLAVPAGAAIEARVARGTLSARVEDRTSAESATVNRNGSDGNERIG